MHFHVSMGIYVYEPGVLDLVPDERYDFPDVVKASSRPTMSDALRGPAAGSTSEPSPKA